MDGVLSELFSLPRRWLLPDLTITELRIPLLQTLRTFGLEVAEFSGEEIIRRDEKCRGPGWRGFAGGETMCYP